MPEIVLELSLSRSSGVLAGVVASLAQAGIELKSQKIQRAPEGRGGWLSIIGEGDPPAPATLAERLNDARGVDRLMRMEVDGQAVLARGRPLDNQIAAEDLVELSQASEAAAETPPLPVDEVADAPARTEVESEARHAASVALDTPRTADAEAIRAVPDDAQAEPAAAPGNRSAGDDVTSEAEPSSAAGETGVADGMQATLRRRRRRRK